MRIFGETSREVFWIKTRDQGLVFLFDESNDFFSDLSQEFVQFESFKQGKLIKDKFSGVALFLFVSFGYPDSDAMKLFGF